jgi:hypothetical protein
VTFPCKLPIGWRVAALLVALYATISSAPDVQLPKSHVGTFGFTTDFAGTVTRLAPDGDAAHKGIHLKHHVDIERTPAESRRYLLDFAYAANGTVATFWVNDGKTTRPVLLKAREATFPFPENAAAVLFGLSYLALIATGTYLLIRTPSWTTAAFYCYAIMTANWSWLMSAILPWNVYKPWASFEAFLYVINWFPLTVFALSFPRGTLDGWRTRVFRVVLGLFAVLLPISIWGVGGYWTHPTGLVTQAIYFEPLGGLFAALVITFLSYRRSEGLERKQLGIVTLALLVGNLCTDLSTVATFSPGVPAVPVWVVNILSGMNIVVPIAVAIAILRYRLFGIVATRAVIFSILTSAILIAKDLLDHYIGKALAETIGDFSLVILILVSFGVAQRPLERWIDSAMFRDQRQARRALRLTSNEIARASRAEQAEALVIEATVRELNLTSASLFHRAPDGFMRGASIGWEGSASEKLDDSDPIVKDTRDSLNAVIVTEAMRVRAQLRDGPSGPVVAIPVLARGEVEAIVLFGPHSSGTDLDQYDLESLRSICAMVGVAFDRLRSEGERT